MHEIKSNFLLSLCMIVKNEEDVIGRCLDSVKNIVDEIIIVDTGSTDSTKEICKKYTDKIYDFEWIDDFSAARNFSFSKATKDYIMWLDADDIIDSSNQDSLKILKENMNLSIDLVMMKYDIAFDENNRPTFTYYRERIFKRSMNYRWIGEIHEVITPSGNISYNDIAISHKKIRPNEPQRNLKIFEKIIKNGKLLEPRQKYYYARELYYNQRYEEAIEEFNSFLAEGKGWIENNISACKDLSNCYYLINDDIKALESLFHSFIYDSPRSEICCDIGKHFFDRNQYEISIFWYELATNKKRNERSGGFHLPDSYEYTPYMQLCVCYDRLGDHNKALTYNEMAGKVKPNDKSYLYNKKYFENKILKGGK